MLRVEAISAGYGDLTVLRDLSFQAAPGQVTCLMGRNGAGKSTLLKAIMGLIPVASGAITLDGEAVHRYTFQGSPVETYPIAGTLTLYEGYGQGMRIVGKGDLYVRSQGRSYLICEGIGFNLGSRSNCNYSMVFKAQNIASKLFSDPTGSENSPTKWRY